MTTQTEAERLAEILEQTDQMYPNADVSSVEVAAELRRLVSFNQQLMDEVARLNKAVADAVAEERTACVRKTEEFARKWWKIHCDSNLHYSSTLKAHQDFCALQAAIKARKNT